MKRTVAAFLLAPLLVPAVEVVQLAYEVHFSRPTTLVVIAVLWVILAYGAALILGLPAFYALSFLRTSVWIAVAVGFGIGVLTGFGLSFFAFSLSPDFGVALVLNHWSWTGWGLGFNAPGLARARLATWWSALQLGVLGSIVAGTLWLIVRPNRRHAA
jgi:hypothetical protein